MPISCDISLSVMTFVNARTKRSKAYVDHRLGTAMPRRIRPRQQQTRHSIFSTSTSSYTGLKPMGNLRSYRSYIPRRMIRNGLHREQRTYFALGLTRKTKLQPMTLLVNVLVAWQAKCMVVKTHGHGSSFRKSLVVTNDWNPCPSLLSKGSFRRMNPIYWRLPCITLTKPWKRSGRELVWLVALATDYLSIYGR